MKMIRKGAVLFGAVALMSLGGAAPASADFHPACLNFAGNAKVDLKTETDSQGTWFVYSMTVNCAQADGITISPLTLTNFFGSIDISSVTTEGQSCLGQTCTVTGRSPATLPGLYRVNGSFTATGHGHTFTNVPRCGRWYWLGAGAPSVITAGTSRTCG